MTSTAGAEAGPALPGLAFVKLVGRGGFADVYLYEQDHPRLRVAVKVLRGEGLDDTVRLRFAAEANAMATLAGHPYIVQVFRSDVTADGRPYMVMKYYPQRNLAVRSRAERIPVPDVLQIGVRIASAVETAHRADILHRDIKPANILTSQYGEPGLTDFGIATTLGQTTTDEADGMSIPWSPPEILFGKSQGDRLSDVYSLGATLWHLLAGRSPFEDLGGDNSTVALLRRIKEQPPTRTGRPDVPPSLERVLAQAMAKNPDERPQSALDLAYSLQAVEREQMLAPTPLSLLEDEEAAPEEEVADEANPATRMRAPQEVSPHRRGGNEAADDPATRRRTTTVSPAPGARERKGIPGQDEGRTVRKAAKVEPPVTPPERSERSETDTRRRRPWPLIAALVVAVAVIVGVGVALAAHSKKGPTTPTTLPGPVPTAPPPVADTPTVSTARLSATQVRYSWTDPGAQPGDTFVVSVSNGPYQSIGTSQTTVLDVPAGSVKCITVEIVRDGATGPASGNC